MTALLAIDQGTTSSRSIVFDASLRPLASAQSEFHQIYPAAGWVEHDPENIWQSVIATSNDALSRSGLAPRDIAAIGIANQRETVVVWDRRTGQPIHNAIVWQDRRTDNVCSALRDDGLEASVAVRTGLLLDPYFSATKIAWLLDHVDHVRGAAEAGHLAFGTIDTYLVWRLTEGRVHVTDATNAARTLLFDIHRGQWDEDLAAIFRVPMAMLPEVRDCVSDFGATNVFGGSIRIRGMAGDQQAATIGQGCFQPGMMKSTYGTGGFALLNTGPDAIRSEQRLLTTIAYQIAGQRIYALEGAIFVAGATIQWLRDGLKLIRASSDTDPLAAGADPAAAVYLVPAFVGMGAPYWDSQARAAIFGLTRDTGAPELARAALDSIGYQTRDLMQAMRADWQGTGDTVLRVDGGMSASDIAMQFLADMLDAPVDRPAIQETTALGAAYLAGLGAGICPDFQGFAAQWQRERRFLPQMDAQTRARKWQGWRDAVRRTLSSS
jgi:glycerol kinase